MEKERKMGTLAKISFVTGFSAFGGVFAYGYFVMDGRNKLYSEDYPFMVSMLIIIWISIIFIIADRAKSKGGQFSWKKFGIILLIVILFGLWRLKV